MATPSIKALFLARMLKNSDASERKGLTIKPHGEKGCGITVPFYPEIGKPLREETIKDANKGAVIKAAYKDEGEDGMDYNGGTLVAGENAMNMIRDTYIIGRIVTGKVTADEFARLDAGEVPTPVASSEPSPVDIAPVKAPEVTAKGRKGRTASA